jgi:hypothetical protein
LGQNTELKNYILIKIRTSGVSHGKMKSAMFLASTYPLMEKVECTLSSLSLAQWVKKERKYFAEVEVLH